MTLGIELCGYPTVKKNEHNSCLLFATEYTNVTDGRTDGQTPHDGIWCAYAVHSVARQTPSLSFTT